MASDGPQDHQRPPETILFVEDEPLVRMDMAEFLRQCGYRVHEAADATEAVLQIVPVVSGMSFSSVVSDGSSASVTLNGNGFVDDVRGWDFFYNVADPAPGPASGHGTHTAGTIGAAGNNGLNVTGVNWNVTIMPIKIYSPAGTDSTSVAFGYTTYSDP